MLHQNDLHITEPRVAAFLFLCWNSKPPSWRLYAPCSILSDDISHALYSDAQDRRNPHHRSFIRCGKFFNVSCRTSTAEELGVLLDKALWDSNSGPSEVIPILWRGFEDDDHIASARMTARHGRKTLSVDAVLMSNELDLLKSPERAGLRCRLLPDRRVRRNLYWIAKETFLQ